MTIKNYFTLASLISVSRLFFLIPIFMFYENTLLVIILIIAAAITDTLDGNIARWTKTDSEEGALVDSICDKIFFIPLFIFVVWKESFSMFALVAFLCRDVLVLVFGLIGGVLMLRKHRLDTFMKNQVKSRVLGKTTTVLLFITLFWILLGLPYTYYVLWVVLLVSIASVVDYTISFLRRYRPI